MVNRNVKEIMVIHCAGSKVMMENKFKLTSSIMS